MVSNRSRYVSESTTDEEVGDMEYLPNNNQQNKPARKPTRTPKCFSKNALMARENRLKKKMYINTLEGQVASLQNDNKKLTQMVDSQSDTIVELKKEVKYLKSILANSEGIGKLMRAINSSTGMSVASSIDRKLTVNNQQAGQWSSTAQKTEPSKVLPEENNRNLCSKGYDFTRHPWEETTNYSSSYRNFPTPESNSSSYYSSPEFEELNKEGLLLDIDVPAAMEDNEFLDIIDEGLLESRLPVIEAEPSSSNDIHFDHTLNIKEEDDVGVCLHVSKNKVSLEFCPSCSDNALQNWKVT